MLLNVSHNNHRNCCDLRQNLNDSPDSFLRTNKISETNVGSNNIQNKNTEIERARNETTVVKVNETFITDNRKARKKKQKTYMQAVTENARKTAHQNALCWKEEL